ncbi:MAG: Mut7-C ubiquitin/RNAse domain-containing protein [Proteobacteria bacterium]|nr:Mut7-C ubiquitin/RNAse domain-containing protein [Pseudomonadota bacterium]
MMLKAFFRFYEELNDFLPQDKKKHEFPFEFSQGESVKTIIEKIGVPHTEVDLILINGISVDFTERLQNNDKVSVYPVFEALDISPVIKLRPKPLRITQFIADSHLGKLAKYLRMIGFDTLFDNHYLDEEIVRVAIQEHRIILTRDRNLLKNPQVSHGYYVREENPELQLKEIVKHFQLGGTLKPFSVCLECNGKIKPVSYDEIKQFLPSNNKEEYKKPSQCANCNKVYWEGSHFLRMQQFIENLLKN